MTKSSIYVETSIISYLIARPTNNLLAAAWQKSTVDWWNYQRDKFDLFISEVVAEEAKRGDPDAALRRMEVLEGLPHLSITDAVKRLSKSFLEEGPLPPKAVDDALHIAIASVHNMDYLLTWNCRHIDNAELKPVLRTICISKGFAYPEICTPQELMGVDENEG